MILLSTDDPAWCQRWLVDPDGDLNIVHIQRYHTRVLAPDASARDFDLAVLASADHLVVLSGTFGSLAAVIGREEI